MSSDSPPRSIGFRVTPQSVFYAVIEKKGDDFTVLAVEEIKCPKALSEPLRLKHVRQSVMDLIREYGTEFAGVKLIEHNAQSPDHFRLNIEGVIQETFASSSLTQYFLAVKSELSRVFKYKDKKKIGTIIDGKEDFEHLALADFGKSHREALLASIAAILEHGN